MVKVIAEEYKITFTYRYPKGDIGSNRTCLYEQYDSVVPHLFQWCNAEENSWFIWNPTSVVRRREVLWNVQLYRWQFNVTVPRKNLEWTGRFKQKREDVEACSVCPSSVKCGQVGEQIDKCTHYDQRNGNNESISETISSSDTKRCMNHFTSQIWWNRETVDLQQICIGSLSWTFMAVTRTQPLVWATIIQS
jgi:hypothetical protein